MDDPTLLTLSVCTFIAIASITLILSLIATELDRQRTARTSAQRIKLLHEYTRAATHAATRNPPSPATAPDLAHPAVPATTPTSTPATIPLRPIRNTGTTRRRAS